MPLIAEHILQGHVNYVQGQWTVQLLKTGVLEIANGMDQVKVVEKYQFDVFQKISNII